jgi:hypothetical protein
MQTTEENTPAEVRERRERAIRLKTTGSNWARIARELGYPNGGVAQRDTLFELERRRRELRGLLDGQLELELEKLDALEGLMWGIIARKHVVIQHGKVVLDPRNQELILDPAPQMQATDRILRIQERRAKFLGLDAAFKVDMKVSDELDVKIEELLEQMQPVKEELPA